MAASETAPSLPSYRDILREELENRCAQNPRYSLRAFARDLKMAPSRLSEILSGKQGLSRQAAEHVAKALGYQGDDRNFFCDLVASLHARSKIEKESSRLRLQKYTSKPEMYQIPMDAFKIISEWYHFAILELTKVKGFRPDPVWIAQALHIQPIQADLALERLLRLKLLQKQGDKLIMTDNDVWTPKDVPSEYGRKAHRQILMKAIEALKDQAVDKRDYTANFVPMTRASLKEAKAEIQKFQHSFCKRLEDACDHGEMPRDAVYCLAIQFFDLSEGLP